jgi:hypothetical protein
MGGKSKSAPPPPDYTPMANASREAAEISKQISAEQLAWAREQYTADSAVTQRYLDVMLPTMERENEAARADRERYQSVFQPIEDRLVAEAENYVTPQRMELEAGRAQADVAQTFDAQRRAALANLESYGVDPSMARAGALDRGARTAQAAVAAGAANQTRQNVEATGRALRGEAINLGRGYQSQIAQAYATSMNAGQGAMSGNLANTASGAGTMGTGVQWTGQQSGFLGNWGAALGGAQRNTAMQMQQNQSNQASSGAMVGAGIGAVASVAAIAI